MVIKVFLDAVTVVEVEVVFVVGTVLLVTGGTTFVDVLSTSRILFPARFSGVVQVAFGP